jgi:hypothetical protein
MTEIRRFVPFRNRPFVERLVISPQHFASTLTQVSAPIPDPRDSRESVFLTAELRVAGADPVRCRVMNLSKRGVCLAQVPDLPSNAKVLVSIGGVERVAAEVMWCRDTLAGLRFDHPIDLLAARRRKPSSVVIPPSAGWAVEVRNAYRK